MARPHHHAVPAELLINDTHISVYVRIREERSVIDDRRDVHGTLWISEAPSALFGLRLARKPVSLVMADGSKTGIIIIDEEVKLGAFARMTFALAEHFRHDEESVDEDS